MVTNVCMFLKLVENIVTLCECRLCICIDNLFKIRFLNQKKLFGESWGWLSSSVNSKGVLSQFDMIRDHWSMHKKNLMISMIRSWEIDPRNSNFQYTWSYRIRKSMHRIPLLTASSTYDCFDVILKFTIEKRDWTKHFNERRSFFKLTSTSISLSMSLCFTSRRHYSKRHKIFEWLTLETIVQIDAITQNLHEFLRT